MNKSSGLGRGLASLIPTKHSTTPSHHPHPILGEEGSQKERGAHEVPIDAIVVNPHQPRKHFSPGDLEDLIASIKEHGILQPLVVTEIRPEQFELIAGERRFRASKMLGLRHVPVVVRNATEQQKLELALIENIQRQDLNAMEEAIAYQALIDQFSLTQDEVAKRVGKSRSVVANTLRLLDLSDEMQQALVDLKISKSHARTLLAEPDAAKREHLFHAMIATGGITVREAEARTRNVKSTISKIKDPNLAAHEKTLREMLGIKVDIQGTTAKGKVSLFYHSKEDLSELLARLAE